MYKNNALNKMLLLSPEVYNKLKNDIEGFKNQSLFDSAVNKILNNKKLSDKEKWYNYRNELIKFFNMKRKSRQIIDRKVNKYSPSQSEPFSQKSFRDNATQTRIIFKDDTSTQTSPIKEEIPENIFDFKIPEKLSEDVFTSHETTPPKKSLSPAAKRRLSASGVAKSLKPPSKIQKTKDYRVITADDGITQYTVPMDMSVDEADSAIQELESEYKTETKQPILRPSSQDPVRKVVRQSERLKAKTRSASVPDFPWERI